jgi:hypothetical protein
VDLVAQGPPLLPERILSPTEEFQVTAEVAKAADGRAGKELEVVIHEAVSPGELVVVVRNEHERAIQQQKIVIQGREVGDEHINEWEQHADIGKHLRRSGTDKASVDNELVDEGADRGKPA